MTPEDHAKLAVDKWWLMGRELHTVRDTGGILMKPRKVLRDVIAVALRDYGEQRAREEREACARIVETWAEQSCTVLPGGYSKVMKCPLSTEEVAARIRARGNEPAREEGEP